MDEEFDSIIEPMKHYKDFRFIKGKVRYLMYKDLPNFVGGYNSVKTYKHKGFSFKIAKSSTEEDIIFSIYKSNICFILKIDLNDKTTAILEGFGNHPKCSTPSLPVNGGGTIMMSFLLHYIKKHQPQINTIELCDNSMIDCEDDKINLVGLYILTTGTTWYGKFGFLPSSKKTNQLYHKNIKIMDKTKTSDLLKKNKINGLEEYKNSTDLLKNDLQALFRKDCSTYTELEQQLFYILGLTNMFGHIFILDMRKYKISVGKT